MPPFSFIAELTEHPIAKFSTLSEDDEDRAYVRVDDIFDIHILRTEEGLIIDVYDTTIRTTLHAPGALRSRYTRRVQRNPFASHPVVLGAVRDMALRSGRSDRLLVEELGTDSHRARTATPPAVNLPIPVVSYSLLANGHRRCSLKLERRPRD